MGGQHLPARPLPSYLLGNLLMEVKTNGGAEDVQDGKDSMCKGPEAGTCLAFLKNRNLKLEEGILYFKGFPGGKVVKNSPANAGDQSSVPGSGRSPGEGNSYTL